MDIIIIDASNADQWSGGFGDAGSDARCRGMFVADGGFYVREMYYPAGMTHPGHSHYIDHVGVLVDGAAIVRWHHEDNLEECGEYHLLVPAKIPVLRDRWHSIHFLKPSRWECWFAKAEADRVYGDASKVPWHLEKPDRTGRR
jgi:hypothetical protein